MNAQDLSSLIAAAVSQAVSAVTGSTPQPIESPELSAEVKEAQAKRQASIEADATEVAEKILTMLKELGFQAETLGRLNRSWGQDMQFAYNSTRASWERTSSRKAYHENKNDEVSLDSLKTIEEQMAQMAARMEQAEIINRACQLNEDKIFKLYHNEVLKHVTDFDTKGNMEQNFLKYNTVPAITEDAYSKYKAKAEAKYQQQAAAQRQAATASDSMLLTTERTFAVSK